ncbi:MAG: RagB/SusD family nutrient uptake outer membrane protein, partial [Cyclobacteriaceae bacterium]|nr:RagB/SusD family nutrient uptake outer membrane protein [Cyclobacteriaceae bacterium]
RSPASEIWSFIKSDLNDAIAGLPEEVDGSGEANKWSALGILADVHLNLGEYSDCKTAIDQVINSEKFELFDNFADVYMDANNNGKHSIFAIQFLNQTGEGNPLPTNQAPKFIDASVWPFAGVGGADQLIPSQQIWDLYDSINDVRRDLSMADQWLDGRDGFVHDELWQLKHGINNQPFAFRVWGINHFVMRYAEALLISAEVENQLDNPARAVELVNMIRSRAKLLDFSSTDKAEIHQEVILQRRLELAFENERWFDIKRQPNYVEIINEFIYYTGTPEGISWNDTYLLYPIPILEISKVGPDILTQNPGY